MRFRWISVLGAIVLNLGLLAGWAQPAAPEGRTNPASPFVPMDSYIYPLFDRLMARGLIDTSFASIRPWTRGQCAHMVREAESKLDPAGDTVENEALALLRLEFRTELQEENRTQTGIDEIYVRTLLIGGSPLTDYHFGQTNPNDFGRPLGEGLNEVLGLSASHTWKSTVLHIQGEYQHAGEPLALSMEQQSALNVIDGLPALAQSQSSSPDRFRLIEAYGGLRLMNINVTVGKQALWWSPSPNGSSMFSTNSEPVWMLRLQQDAPIRLPWLFRYLGPMRWDGFFGKVEGHQFPRDPWVHGQKVSFKPTRNFELGFSRTVQFAGAGRGLTFGSFWRSFASVGDRRDSTPGTPSDVGDRRGGFDFSYRLPGLRNLVTVYGDFFTDDDPSPLSAPQRSGWMPGVYIARLPHANRMDLRVEALVTDQSATSQYHGSFFYFNQGYKDGYTNRGQLIGSWIGRDAKAVVASSRLWISPATNVHAIYRNVKTNPGYLTGGGTQHDARLCMNITRSSYRVEAFLQYEQWRIPFLSSSLQRDYAIGLRLGFRPK